MDYQTIRRYAQIGGVGLALVLLLVGNVGAQAPIPPAVEADATRALYAMDAEQARVYAETGAYTQVRSLTATGLTCSQAVTNCVALTLAVTSPLTVSVDTYLAPAGAGFVINVDWLQWRQSINQGPELWRNSDWHIRRARPWAR
jgi:hypothetical protein